MSSIKVNRVSNFIYWLASYHKSKLIARDHSLFTEIRFEMRTRCNGRCDFCPCSIYAETRPDVWMTDKCYVKIVDELADLNWSGDVKFYINNEPLLDDRLPDFMEYLQSKNLRLNHVCIQTNGLLLTIDLAKKLFDNGLTWLIANDYSTDGKLSQKHMDTLNYIRSHFPDKRIDFYQRSSHDILGNRAGFAPNKPCKVMLTSCCIYPFRQLNITANGDVGMCCQDVFIQNPMGNVNEQSLVEIWHGEHFRMFRKNLFKGKRNLYDLCRYCDFEGTIKPPQKYNKIYNPLLSLARKLQRKLNSKPNKALDKTFNTTPKIMVD